MRISFKHTPYEMTLFDGMRFRIIAAWFPLRRLLRAIKRAVIYLKTWIATLILFLPICLAVYYLLLRFHIFLRPEDAVIELVSILLGSIALLAIKEFHDSEAIRRQKLQQQWESYTNCQFEFTGALHNLANIAGIIFDGTYYVLTSSKSCNDAFTTYHATNPTFDKDAIHANLSRITQAADSLLDDALRIGFIDWDYSEVKDNRYKHLCEEIANVERHSDNSLDNNDVLFLANRMVDFLAAARRPWRYRNDIAHKKLLERFLEEHGEPL